MLISADLANLLEVSSMLGNALTIYGFSINT